MPERRHGVTTLTENATKRLQAIVEAERDTKTNWFEPYTLAPHVGQAVSYRASGLR